MKTWLRRIRGALGMGLIWAIGWAVVGGGVMEGIVDPEGKILDMWPQTLAIPGFLGGVAFSIVLWIAAGRRRFDELSLFGFGIWGAVTGLLLGVLAVGTGLASSALSLWLRVAVIIGPLTLLSALSAAGSLALARMTERREAIHTGADEAEASLTEAPRQR